MKPIVLEIYLGTGKADEVAEAVANGEMTPEAAEAWAISLKEMHEQSRGRRDIEPDEWQDFEDGWRP